MLADDAGEPDHVSIAPISDSEDGDKDLTPKLGLCFFVALIALIQNTMHVI